MLPACFVRVSQFSGHASAVCGLFNSVTPMNDRETRRYEMFGRVLSFGQARTAEFPANSKAAGYFASLAKTVQDLDAAKVAQGDATTTTAKVVLLDALRLDLHNVARTARAIAQDEPGFADHYRLPDTPAQSALMTAADTILQRLQPAAGDSAAAQAAKTALVKKFTDHELPADFVSHLAADRAAIAAAQDTVDSESSTSVGSTSAIGQLIRQGLSTVTYLDAVMHNKYSRQPDQIRAWQAASHTDRAPQREKPAAPAPVAAAN